jgi:hypothetical protein
MVAPFGAYWGGFGGGAEVPSAASSHTPSAALGRRYRNDPLSTELLSKKSLFYCASRSYCMGAGQRVRSFREVGIDGGYVQDCRQPSIDTEHRRAGAA